MRAEKEIKEQIEKLGWDENTYEAILTWALEGEPRYAIKEIPFPKEPCFLVIDDSSQEELEYVSGMLKEKKANDKIIFCMNKDAFLTEPRYSVAELEKIADSNARKKHNENCSNTIGFGEYDSDFELENFLVFLKDSKRVQEVLE